VVSGNEPTPPPRQRSRTAQIDDLLPLRDWFRHRALRSWPVIHFLILVCVPSIALVILGRSPSASTFDHVAWIFAADFALAWLLILGVIVRPEHVTSTMLVVVIVIAMATQIPLAVALETALHATTSSLGSAIVDVAIPEELAKALPVLAIALLYGRRLSLNPRDYLFLGAVSGLAFGAAEVVRYFTVNGDAEFYLTIQSAIPSIHQMMRAGVSAPVSLFSELISPVLEFILDFVWRFAIDPITHACWSGLTGYFIGLAVTRCYKWYQVGWMGLAIATLLHGLNDWSRVNGHPLWIVVVLISGILFLGYAKVGTRHDLPFPYAERPPDRHAHAEPGRPAGSEPRKPWWEH
jgi:RsiW-degrading membrane proteinase PrsW (M82 family)